jgi:hypothetical protein
LRLRMESARIHSSVREKRKTTRDAGCHRLAELIEEENSSEIDNGGHSSMSQLIYTYTFTHAHPPEQISRSLYTPCYSMKHDPEGTATVDAGCVLKI